jgi:hypothetical protein
MLKIKDNVDLKELEKFGFEEDIRFIRPKAYSYKFLVVFENDKSISIESFVDEVNGDDELLKFFDLIKAGLVEKVD